MSNGDHSENNDMPIHELDTLEKRIKHLIESHALRGEILCAQLAELNRINKAFDDAKAELGYEA